MNRTQKIGLLVAILALIATVIHSQRATLSVALMERVLEQRLATSSVDHFKDGLHVILCGAGSPLPDPKRSGPCVAILAGDTLVTVDAGTGSSRQMTMRRIPLGEIQAQFLTHFHSDHIDGLGELAVMRWVNNANTSPLPVIGPMGTKAIVEGFNQAYKADARYRQLHHGDAVAPLSGQGMVAQEFATPEPEQALKVFEHNGLVVTAFIVGHSPVEPAVGYRFDYKGRSAVVSGDTVKSYNLQKMSQDVDLLVHEALSPELVATMNRASQKAGNAIAEKVTADIPDYHATPVEAAEIAETANVGHLMYYHIVPPLLVPGMEAAFLAGVDDVYQGPLNVGVDGSYISLPANSDAIESGILK